MSTSSPIVDRLSPMILAVMTPGHPVSVPHVLERLDQTLPAGDVRATLADLARRGVLIRVPRKRFMLNPSPTPTRPPEVPRCPSSPNP